MTIKSLALLAAMACGSAPPAQNPILAGKAEVPAAIGAACDLAARRCTRCHTIDRVLLARVESPEHWRMYVDRMRRQSESGISPEDGQVIVRCLVYRSFGTAGLRALQGGNDSL